VTPAVRDVCRRRFPQLFFWSHFVPQPKRDAVRSLAAFLDLTCKTLEAEDHHADERLELFRNRLQEMYEERLELPEPQFCDQTQQLLAAVAQVIHQFDIPQQHLLDFAEGCRTDSIVGRYATWRALEAQLDRTAGVVGRMVLCVLGARHSDAAQHSALLGKAIRMTDILCTVGQDRERDGRIYLPLEDLARFRYSERDLAAGVVNDAFREMMRFEVSRARQLFRDGSAGIAWLADDGSRLAVSAIVVSRMALLDAIERQNFDVFSRRPTVGRMETLAQLPAVWRMARRAS
jgi:15-cis-phytoene synthase